MRFDLAALLALARESVVNPRGVARALMALDLPMQARWLALALTVVMSVILAQLALLVSGFAPTSGSAVVAAPLMAAAMQAGVMLAVSVGIAQVGRAMGGGGGFADAMLLVTWAEFVLVLLQVAQLVLSLVLPVLADLTLILGIALFFWLLTWFTVEMHGFHSAAKVFFALLGGFFLAGLVLVSLLGSIGVAPVPIGV